MFTRWYPKFHHNLHSWGSSYRSKWAINFGRSSRFMRREIPYTGLDKKLGDCEVPMHIMKIDCLCEIPSWLVVWNIFYFPFNTWDVILPIDELHHFSEGWRKTTTAGCFLKNEIRETVKISWRKQPTWLHELDRLTV
jgi:hypothetical protein